MNTKDLLLREIEQVPEFLLTEVLDFLQFLKAKHLEENTQISILSESSLAKDWLKPEEDEAWQDL
ncbi:DUF2281 domain-containing protein [Hassallia byssoidea VB512170]|uniref:DUF2281 domain-containing protein n=1 Tax=Hassallia byssoidea VB512170 TaxID=1304833 RepID=A0A846HFU1_9CYAN|nr:DUF2281 domain-containing protein [Hassalia byssoidea]NEU75520.1 DUF2281 domain-containing protein [Hassalia byssoidea VB512170]